MWAVGEVVSFGEGRRQHCGIYSTVSIQKEVYHVQCHITYVHIILYSSKEALAVLRERRLMMMILTSRLFGMIARRLVNCIEIKDGTPYYAVVELRHNFRATNNSHEAWLVMNDASVSIIKNRKRMTVSPVLSRSSVILP